VNRTLTKKLIYVIAALTLLAMLIPAMAVPVSAAPGGTYKIEVQTVTWDPTANPPANVYSWAPDGFPGDAYNASGSVVKITVLTGATTGYPIWDITSNTAVFRDTVQYGNAHWVGAAPVPGATEAQVTGVWGEAVITLTFASGDPVSIHKKWGMIDRTVIGGPISKNVTWNESTKSFFASGNITDTVIGDFDIYGEHFLQGTILNWYLISGDVPVPMDWGNPVALNAAMALLTPATYVQFVDSSFVPTPPTLPNPNIWDHTKTGWNGTFNRTTVGKDGQSDVKIGAWFEESVQVVVVPQYPNDPNRLVKPEITTYNFKTYEYDAVPQVRWAGEKIVLEANFGHGFYTNGEVQFFFQNQSVGTLEGLDDNSEARTVWARVDDNGIASAILTSSVAGEADVSAALYPRGRNAGMTNQQTFKVYFLNFFSLTLRDVNGKREQHNAGVWKLANPWGRTSNPYNDTFPFPPDAGLNKDLLTQTANVSQDTLERAQVRGWFMPNAAPYSTRQEVTLDLNANGQTDMADVVVPKGYYILPDDWQYLITDTTYALHWDIMDSPFDNVTALDPLGDYYKGTTPAVKVGDAPTVGPFTPGIEKMTPMGWMVSNPITDHRRAINTVVPNGLIDVWDAPMPPAKVIFQVTGAGYLKETNKKGVYYIGSGTTADPYKYTEPFYEALIPAHWAIPPFNNEGGGGYDWDSFDGTHNNYYFWKILNRPAGSGQYPTRVEVYSDNHGEAMVYLNGNYNLDLSNYDRDGAADIQPGYTVGSSVVRASAIYPYVHLPKTIISNTVSKTWTWGGLVLGADVTEATGHPYKFAPGVTDKYLPDGGYMGVKSSRMVLSSGDLNDDPATWPNGYSASNKKAVFIWVTDRDGKQGGVLGAQVRWSITSTSGIVPTIALVNSNSLNDYNGVTQSIGLSNGFLKGTNGTIGDPLRQTGTSYLMSPGKDNINNVVLGALDNNNRTNAPYVGKTALEALFYKFYNPQALASGLQPDDFAVAMIEITTATGAPTGPYNVKTQITSADFYLGPGNYPTPTLEYETNGDFSNVEPIDDPPIYGDANFDGVVNMGDVTTIERIILGLNLPNSRRTSEL